jgi:hypothetical protein
VRTLGRRILPRLVGMASSWVAALVFGKSHNGFPESHSALCWSEVLVLVSLTP